MVSPGEVTTRTVTLAVTLLLAALSNLTGQDTPTLEVGQRVRVYAARTAGDRWGRFDGFVLSVDSGGLEMQPELGPPLYVPLGSLRVLQRHSGRRSHVLHGLMIGGGIGALAGLMSSAIATSECAQDTTATASQGFCGTNAALTSGAIGSVAGTAIGAVIGAVFRSDRWEDIPFDRFGLWQRGRPGRGLGLRLSVRF